MRGGTRKGPERGEGVEITDRGEIGRKRQWQGSTLTVVLWPQASKKFPKWLRASKRIPQLILQGQ